MKYLGRVVRGGPDGEPKVQGFRLNRLGRSAQAFTLAEVLISLAIAAIMFSGIINAYVQSSYRAEWSGYSLAAQSLAIQQLEQARAASWDISTSPARNEITNVPPVTTAILDLPVNGTNIVWATNYTTIISVPITNTIGASIYMVKVDTAWPFIWGGKCKYYTNTVADFFAPD
ncbi:MAG TPA: type II secretion system protein [Verrucomicrobiae bacterium]|nr:type II secretion system protein [Verrucomicrobiae bacterium]